MVEKGTKSKRWDLVAGRLLNPLRPLQGLTPAQMGCGVPIAYPVNALRPWNKLQRECRRGERGEVWLVLLLSYHQCLVTGGGGVAGYIGASVGCCRTLSARAVIAKAV